MSARDEIAKVIQSVTGLWDEPLDEVHDIPPIADALLASPAFADLIREAKREGWERRDKPWTHGDKQVPIVPPELRDDSGTHEVECAGWNDCHCFGYLNPYDKETS